MHNDKDNNSHNDVNKMIIRKTIIIIIITIIIIIIIKIRTTTILIHMLICICISQAYKCMIMIDYVILCM